MRPIETTYREVKFRSRLEARWARFFDAMEYAWLYERMPVILGDGTSYTPDFFLPKQGCYIEVKPEWPTKLEIDKMRVAARERPLILVIGKPDFTDYWMLFQASDGPDEKNVRLEWRGDHWESGDSEDFFSITYHIAVEKAARARFDGYDEDRETIRSRYR